MFPSPQVRISSSSVGSATPPVTERRYGALVRIRNHTPGRPSRERAPAVGQRSDRLQCSERRQWIETRPLFLSFLLPLNLFAYGFSLYPFIGFNTPVDLQEIFLGLWIQCSVKMSNDKGQKNMSASSSNSAYPSGYRQRTKDK